MARELGIKISVDSSQAKRELNAVEGELKDVTTEAQTMEKGLKVSTVNIGKVLGAVAAGITALKIGDEARKAVDAASRIADASARIGIGAEAMQRLQFAAEQGGSSLEAVGVAMGQMASVLGGDGAAKALAAVGLTLADIKNLTPDQTFMAIADAIAKIPDPLRQADAARDVFGRGALELLPAIKAGFKDVGDQAPVMSAAMVQSGDEIGDKMAALHRRIDTLKAQALLPLADFFVNDLPASVQIGAAGLLAFVPSMDTLVLGIMASGGPMAALGSLKVAALGVGTFFSATLPGLFAAAVTFFTTTLPAAIGTVIAFLGPQGLIALAILALLAVWYFFGDEISAVVSKIYTVAKTWLVDKWGDIKAGVSAALTAIATYFGTLRDRAVEFMRLTYEGVKRWLVDQFAAIVAGVKQKIDAVIGYFKGMYDAVVGQSYVPDMMQRIGDEFGTLEGRMVGPTNHATSLVQGAFRTMASAVEGLVQNMIAKISGLLTSWADKFLPSWAAQLVGGLTNSALGNLVGRIPGLGGGSGGGGLLQTAGGFLPGLLGGGGSSAAASVAGIDAQVGAMSGAGAGGGGAMSFLTNPAFWTNPFTIAAIGAGVLGLGVWKKGWFRGGEEALKVNPARDAFMGQFQGQFGGNRNDATIMALEAAGLGGERAGALMSALNAADTMKEFEAASQAIERALANPSTGAVPALQDAEAATATLTTAWTDAEAQLLRVTPAIDDLTASLGVFREELDAVRILVPESTRTAWTPSEPVEGFAAGTMGRFVNFGAGQLAVLHHREAVVRPGDPVPILNGERSGGGDVHVGPIEIRIDAGTRNAQALTEEIAERLPDAIRRNFKGARTRFRLALGVSRSDQRRPGASPWE